MTNEALTVDTFGGIEEEYAQYETAAILLQSVPYDETSTWGKGADKGFDSFLEASANMELYDIETQSEVYKQGIYIQPSVLEKSSPDALVEATYKAAQEALASNKFPTFFGGEHSISIGIIRAFKEKYPNLSVLHLDAHGDLRPEYLGSPYSHACAMHEASKTVNLVQVGIRSMDTVEQAFWNPKQGFLGEAMYGQTDWMQESINLLGNEVYISFDLDVLDPSIMPATGTPEPGGLDWNTTIQYLRKVFEQRQVVGFDLVELAPIPACPAPNFLVAKLYYKMLTYKFQLS